MPVLKVGNGGGEYFGVEPDTPEVEKVAFFQNGEAEGV